MLLGLLAIAGNPAFIIFANPRRESLARLTVKFDVCTRHSGQNWTSTERSKNSRRARSSSDWSKGAFWFDLIYEILLLYFTAKLCLCVSVQELKFTLAVTKMKGYFEAFFEQHPPFKLSLIEINTEETVWSATIREGTEKVHESYFGDTFVFWKFVFMLTENRINQKGFTGPRPSFALPLGDCVADTEKKPRKRTNSMLALSLFCNPIRL